MKEYRASFTGQDGKTCYKYFDTMEQAQEFYDSRTETVIQKLNPETGEYEDAVYPIYEF
ncbi:MAG: hypothetical protein HFI95_04720 [Lachnospiraceae bacterium]|nr:hypothetical protein [Lachnospiraceae bacterium]